MPADWHHLLACASTSDEVISLARQFMMGLDSVALAALPEALRPARMAEAHDVTSYAVDLMRHHRDEGDAARTIESLAGFFSQAAARLSQLSIPSSHQDVAKLFG